MKHIATLIFLVLLISCGYKKTLNIDSSKVSQIEIFQGYPGIKLQMKDGFEKEFIADINKSIDVGATKYMKTHSILIHYTDKSIDTIYSNGNIHHYKKWYKSDENLIDKYAIKQMMSIDSFAE